MAAGGPSPTDSPDGGMAGLVPLWSASGDGDKYFWKRLGFSFKIITTKESYRRDDDRTGLDYLEALDIFECLHEMSARSV